MDCARMKARGRRGGRRADRNIFFDAARLRAASGHHGPSNSDERESFVTDVFGLWFSVQPEIMSLEPAFRRLDAAEPPFMR